MLSLANFAAETYGYTVDYIYNQLPLISIMLLLRQKLASEGKTGIFLSDKEMIDNNNWDELLKKSKENSY